MRYAAIRPLDISNGEGLGVALFVQGCSLHCKECFQPETWDFNGGQEFTQETKEKIFNYLRQPGITRLTILGGEPLEECNLFELSKLIRQVREQLPDIEIWLYSGYTIEQLIQRMRKQQEVHYLKYILDNVDVLIDGPFIEEEKDLGLEWRGSANQQYIKLNNRGH